MFGVQFEHAVLRCEGRLHEAAGFDPYNRDMVEEVRMCVCGGGCMYVCIFCFRLIFLWGSYCRDLCVFTEPSTTPPYPGDPGGANSCVESEMGS